MTEIKTMEKKFFTVMDFYRELGGVVTKTQIYRMINAGEIPSRRIGTKIVIPANWVHEFVNKPCEYAKKYVGA